MEAVAVISLAAAALSIAKFVKTTVRFAKLLYHVAKNAPALTGHMRGFAVTFENFARVVRLAMKGRHWKITVAIIQTPLSSRPCGK